VYILGLFIYKEIERQRSRKKGMSVQHNIRREEKFLSLFVTQPFFKQRKEKVFPEKNLVFTVTFMSLIQLHNCRYMSSSERWRNSSFLSTLHC